MCVRESDMAICNIYYIETWTKSSAGDYKTFGEEYDWTFTTAYDGSVSSTSDNLLTFSESETGIDYDQLKIKEPILWYYLSMSVVCVFNSLFKVPRGPLV